jgi:hypothetical protein
LLNIDVVSVLLVVALDFWTSSVTTVECCTVDPACCIDEAEFPLINFCW